jgi:hypothetical protein
MLCMPKHLQALKRVTKFGSIQQQATKDAQKPSHESLLLVIVVKHCQQLAIQCNLVHRKAAQLHKARQCAWLILHCRRAAAASEQHLQQQIAHELRKCSRLKAARHSIR